MKLNPRKVDVYGYENPKYLEILVPIMIGMVDGNNIPPVRLCTFDNGKSFQVSTNILFPYFDGGHHRLLGAYLLGESLEVDINEHESIIYELSPFRKIHLRDINLISDVNALEFSRRLGCFYLPLPSVEVFFRDYIKVNLGLKFGTHTDYSFSPESYENFRENVERTLN